MDRELVSEAELLDLLNAELRKETECGKIRFRSIRRIEPDADGCNWIIENPCAKSGVPGEVYVEDVRTVYARMRKKYNLAD